MTTTLAVGSPTVKTTLPPRPPDFLRAWFATCPSDQFVELRAIRVSDHHVHQEFFTLDAMNDLYARACELVEEYDDYFGVCPRIRPQGRKEDVTHAPGLWADLDFKGFPDGEAGALRKLGEFPVPPSWIVATGGGFHIYWKLREAVTADAAFEARLKGIVHALDADPAATDRSRVLRIPGTFNHKYPDCQVRILKWPTSS
jgi:hypothetical protein